MGVYNTSSVYKGGRGVYRSGIYKGKAGGDYVVLDGVTYQNSFYEIDSSNVGSTFVDAVSLPEGYTKLARVWYGGTIGNSKPYLLNTDYELTDQFGDIYIGAFTESITTGFPSARILSTRIVNESDKTVSVRTKTRVDKYYAVVFNEESKETQIDRTASLRLSDFNKIKVSLTDGADWVDLPGQTGNPISIRNIDLLSSRSLTYLRFVIIVDREKNVTFTAIPCKHGDAYGVYDLVGGKFYTHPNLTGE